MMLMMIRISMHIPHVRKVSSLNRLPLIYTVFWPQNVTNRITSLRYEQVSSELPPYTKNTLHLSSFASHSHFDQYYTAITYSMDWSKIARRAEWDTK